jgi:hypothetical protein
VHGAPRALTSNTAATADSIAHRTRDVPGVTPAPAPRYASQISIARTKLIAASPFRSYKTVDRIKYLSLYGATLGAGITDRVSASAPWLALVRTSSGDVPA